MGGLQMHLRQIGKAIKIENLTPWLNRSGSVEYVWFLTNNMKVRI
jgi:hypothetical protein